MTSATEPKSASESQPSPPSQAGGGGVFRLLRDKPYLFLILFGILIVLPPGIFIYERQFIADRTPQLVEVRNSEYSQKLSITINDIDVDSGIAQVSVHFTTLDPELANKQIRAVITNGKLAPGNDEPIFETSQHRVSFTMNPPPTMVMQQDSEQDSEQDSGQNVQQDDIVFEENDVQIRVEGQGDLYPFDSYPLRLQITLSTHEKPVTEYTTYFWLKDSQLIYYGSPVNMLVQEDGDLTHRRHTVQVTLHRPAYYVLYIISILLLMFFIVSWTLWRVYHRSATRTESPFEVLGLNLAIILAIPDVRGLLVPEGLTYVPVVDTSLATITMLSLYCVIIYIVNRRNLRHRAVEERREAGEDTDTTDPEESEGGKPPETPDTQKLV
jgi:hypothetical protein